jgi:hypothetical protein
MRPDAEVLDSRPRNPGDRSYPDRLYYFQSDPHCLRAIKELIMSAKDFSQKVDAMIQLDLLTSARELATRRLCVQVFQLLIEKGVLSKREVSDIGRWLIEAHIANDSDETAEDKLFTENYLESLRAFVYLIENPDADQVPDVGAL